MFPTTPTPTTPLSDGQTSPDQSREALRAAVEKFNEILGSIGGAASPPVINPAGKVEGNLTDNILTAAGGRVESSIKISTEHQSDKNSLLGLRWAWDQIDNKGIRLPQKRLRFRYALYPNLSGGSILDGSPGANLLPWISFPLAPGDAPVPGRDYEFGIEWGPWFYFQGNIGPAGPRGPAGANG